MFIDIVGVFSVIFTAIAYSRKNKIEFLKFNIVAVSGLSLILISTNGIIGGLTGFWSVILYIIALLTIDNKLLNKKLSISTPLVSFSFFLLLSDGVTNGNLINIIPAISYIFITYSIFQQDLLRAKTFLLAGCLIWLSYTIYIGNPYPIIADAIGIITLTFSILSNKAIGAIKKPSSTT